MIARYSMELTPFIVREYLFSFLYLIIVVNSGYSSTALFSYQKIFVESLENEGYLKYLPHIGLLIFSS
jgi:hypothetical protein